jgi:mRNA interferase RelE/StbE
MSYMVKLRPSAQRELDTLPEKDYQIIEKVISSLEQNPRPAKVKRLAGSALWRVRVRRYRVVYAINEADQVVTIVRVARRKEDTYKGL